MADYEQVLLGHGSGGTLTADLIQRVFMQGYGSQPPPALEDQATLRLGSPGNNGHKSARIALTTDSLWSGRRFSPAATSAGWRCMARSTIWPWAGPRRSILLAAFILEEGLPMADLRRIVASMREACAEAGVSIVTGVKTRVGLVPWKTPTLLHSTVASDFRVLDRLATMQYM